ncbi:hypothetical protein [Bacillus mycoides]|uniref:hypothetical protein n=1 Tax=Bacillus mycoides TaxID=1405 RepID=UPI001C03488C|nr:hypothetical protein [Bacillus mycoides]QWI55258.1 hypothetical protein EXW42_14230 [Bacillus mycoides]QWI91863.1 hypothetical protein J5W00_10365 [Bacillus mycoides]
MMNSIKNLLAGTTKVKTEEAALQAIDKLQAQENDLQGKLQEAQAEHTKVSEALEIVEATLIIDSADKGALATQKKAQSKLETLAKQIASTQDELSKVAEKKQAAVKELYRSRGEIARKHNVLNRRNMAVASRFNRTFHLENALRLITIYDPNVRDLGVEYGVGATDNLDPRSEDWQFIVGMSDEDVAEGDRQAEVIAREIEEAIKGVFTKNGIELSEQTLINLSRI